MRCTVFPTVLSPIPGIPRVQPKSFLFWKVFLCYPSPQDSLPSLNLCPLQAVCPPHRSGHIRPCLLGTVHVCFSAGSLLLDRKLLEGREGTHRLKISYQLSDIQPEVPGHDHRNTWAVFHIVHCLRETILLSKVGAHGLTAIYRHPCWARCGTGTAPAQCSNTSPLLLLQSSIVSLTSIKKGGG